MKFKPDPKPDFFQQKLTKKETIQKKKELKKKKHNVFFKLIWNNNPHICYECGIKVPFYNIKHIHHIIAKRFQNIYNVSLDTIENGIIVCWQCHSQAEVNMDKTPKIKSKTIEMIKEYEQYLIF